MQQNDRPVEHLQRLVASILPDVAMSVVTMSQVGETGTSMIILDFTDPHNAA
jgi:hypothetical protein